MHISSHTVLNPVQDNQLLVCDYSQLLTNAYGSPANIKDLKQLVIGVLIALSGKPYCLINN